MKMRARTVRSAGLAACVVALALSMGATSALADPRPPDHEDIEATLPSHREKAHKPDKVMVKFKEKLRAEPKAGEDDDGRHGATITVTSDECDDEVVSGATTIEGRLATVALTERFRGRHQVLVEYWLEEDDATSEEDEEGEEGEDPDPEPPPDDEPEKPETYSFWFNTHGGTDCDGKKDQDKDKSHDGHGDKDKDKDKGGHDGHGDKDKKQSWGSTSGSGGHHGGHGDTTDMRTATAPGTSTTTGMEHSTHSMTPSFSSPTSSTMPSSTAPSTSDHSNHTKEAPAPALDEGLEGPFSVTTGESPLADPTAPSTVDGEPGVLPQEADEQQRLSAAPSDVLEPESGTLLVALATALLLGVGGGLFLRKTDPSPVRARA